MISFVDQPERAIGVGGIRSEGIRLPDLTGGRTLLLTEDLVTSIGVKARDTMEPGIGQQDRAVPLGAKASRN